MINVRGVMKFPSIFPMKYEFIINATCPPIKLVSPLISQRNSRNVDLKAAALIKDGYTRVAGACTCARNTQGIYTRQKRGVAEKWETTFRETITGFRYFKIASSADPCSTRQDHYP